jgi:pyridoxine/pyridoxamine 5'-phosphate oxidase
LEVWIGRLEYLHEQARYEWDIGKRERRRERGEGEEEGDEDTMPPSFLRPTTPLAPVHSSPKRLFLLQWLEVWIGRLEYLHEQARYERNVEKIWIS